MNGFGKAACFTGFYLPYLLMFWERNSPRALPYPSRMDVSAARSALVSASEALLWPSLPVILYGKIDAPEERSTRLLSTEYRIHR
jgi:hypothetical protein